MSKPVTIVVLAKYKEIFKPFLESVSKYAQEIQRVLVADGEEPKEALVEAGYTNFTLIKEGVSRAAFWTIVQGPEQFAMAGNCNLGWKAVPEDSDILYCGDDVRFLEPETVERLQTIAYKDPTIGILSPRIYGRASNALANPTGETVYVRPIEMWFPCVYIKRELINKIGYLDERFNDFGSDDLDYCIRAQLAGYKLACTALVTVAHEMSPEGGPTTFVKKLGVEEYQKQQEKAFKKLQEKYEVSEHVLMRALRSGDSSLLTKKEVEVVKDEKDRVSTEKKPPSEAEAKRLLSEGIYVATPCYGGMMTVNYAQSLLGLSDLCRAHEVPFAVSFVYNESLITRARNKMVADYLNNSNLKNFFFIDADISFDPKDIISLVFHDEMIIGAPCVRKNLRLDRIVSATKKNGRDYSVDELAKLCGEFVVNFEPSAAPRSMNLGQLIEVQDVGTGLMRIKREAFNIVEKKFPDRYYLPMMGEGGETKPHYLFFQSEVDLDSGKHNPGGLPHYIAEDYAFCRLAKKAGIKVYLAPWLKTDHMGAYLFKGDLEAVAKAGGILR